MTVDLAYDRAQQDKTQQLYEIGFTDSATIENIQNNLSVTLGFKL